ncbi:MAG: glutaredoxin family protein [Gemmataceae bacterium]
MLGWLRRQFARLPRQRPDLSVVMYHRKDCHLCENAWEQLVAAQTQYGFALERKDVDADSVALQEYGECVPVVTVNGVVRFRGRVNDVLLRRLLDAPR